MIADLKPYEEYKESELPWLGQVPGHWALSAVRHVARPRKGKQPRTLYSEHELTGVAHAYLTMEYLRRHQGSAEVYCAPDDALVTAVAGDVLLLWDGANAGEFLLAKDGVVSSTAALLTTTEHDKRFLFSVLKQCEPRLRALATGMGIPHVDGGVLKQMQICLPPPAEQAAIVRLLDWANGRLERAIRAKRKVIALLNEQKEAIIHRAVTRGLDPSVPFKSSGNPWLGDIPQHWEGLQVRRVVSFVTSGSRGWANFYSDDGLIFLQSGNLGRSMSLNLINIQHVRPPDGAEGERTRVRRNDVLICVTGALTGNVVIVAQDLPAPAHVNQHVALVRPKPGMIEPRFLAYVLHSEVGRTQFKTNEYGGTKQGLGLGDVKSVFIPVPPLPQQRAICAELDIEVAGFKEASSRLEREIELLREYRTRLVADVVTGKLDVREAAVRLPDEASLDTDEDAADLTDEAEVADEEATV